jgi:exonuclease SbcC
VRLHSLHLLNFRQHADTRVEFDLGLTGIIGPNGGGKTTILEAIAWALYGQPAARGTKDSIRFLRAPPRAPVRVELAFDLAGHGYRVVRGLTSAELYLDGGTEPVASTLMGVTDTLQRRLGMTRGEFFNTYFTGQKELNVMAAMTPAERGQFLSRVLGYDRLRTAQGLVRERRKLIAAESAGLRSALPDPDAVGRLLDEARRKLADAARRREAAEARRREAEIVYGELAPRWDAAQKTREALQQVLSEIRVAQNESTSRSRDLERVERELAEIAVARVELEALAVELAPLHEMIREFQQLEDLAREEGRRQALTEGERSAIEEIERMRVSHAKKARAPLLEVSITEKLQRKRRELDESSGALEARRTEWVRDRQEAETKRDALRRQWGELKVQRDRILDLGEEGVCPTCTQVLGKNFRTVLDQIEEQLETIQVDGRYYNTRLEQLDQMPDDLQQLEAQRRALAQEVATLERQLARVQSAVQELAQLSRDIVAKEERRDALRRELQSLPTGYDATRHAELRVQVAGLAPLNERVTRLSAQIEREPVLAGERGRVQEELAVVRRQLEELQSRHDATNFSEEAYAQLRARFEAAATASHSAELLLTGALSDETAARDALGHAERTRQEMERTQEAYARLQRERKLHDELDRAYSDLRTDLNLQLRPELSELASSFLTDLTDGRYTELELDDHYNVVVLEDGIPKPVISGGEEDLSNLVLRLAISQMIAERAGQAFSLLVLDEVFGSLDDARRRNVVELLRHLQDRFEQVILITHIESVRDELDRVIRVEYDEDSGSSRVRQEEPAVLPELVTSEPALERAGAADV